MPSATRLRHELVSILEGHYRLVRVEGGAVIGGERGSRRPCMNEYRKFLGEVGAVPNPSVGRWMLMVQHWGASVEEIGSDQPP